MSVCVSAVLPSAIYMQCVQCTHTHTAEPSQAERSTTKCHGVRCSFFKTSIKMYNFQRFHLPRCTFGCTKCLSAVAAAAAWYQPVNDVHFHLDISPICIAVLPGKSYNSTNFSSKLISACTNARWLGSVLHTVGNRMIRIIRNHFLICQKILTSRKMGLWEAAPPF